MGALVAVVSGATGPRLVGGAPSSNARKKDQPAEMTGAALVEYLPSGAVGTRYIFSILQELPQLGFPWKRG